MEKEKVQEIAEEIVLNLFKGDWVGAIFDTNNSERFNENIDQLTAEIRNIIIKEAAPKLINEQPLDEQIEFFADQLGQHDKSDELIEILANMAARKLKVEDLKTHFEINTINEVVEILRSWLLENSTWEETIKAMRIIINALGVPKLVDIFLDNTNKYIAALNEIDSKVFKAQNEVWDKVMNV